LSDSSISSNQKVVLSGVNKSDNNEEYLDHSRDAYMSFGINRIQASLNKQRMESLSQMSDEQNISEGLKSKMTKHVGTKSILTTQNQHSGHDRHLLLSKKGKQNPVVALCLKYSKCANSYICKRTWTTNQIIKLSTGKTIGRISHVDDVNN
jgi:hypothetical protein